MSDLDRVPDDAKSEGEGVTMYEGEIVRRLPVEGLSPTFMRQLGGQGLPLDRVRPASLAQLGDIANVRDAMSLQSEAASVWLQTHPDGKGMSLVSRASVGGFIFKRTVEGSLLIEKW